jgi:hypothetical protein
MTHEPKTTETILDCKLKAVNPPFRSVSTPRGRKDLRVVGRVNPEPAAAPTSLPDGCAERLRERRQIATAWRTDSDLVRDASCRDACVAQGLHSALSELV